MIGPVLLENYQFENVAFVFLKWFFVKKVTLICLIEFKLASLIEINGNLHLATKQELVIKKQWFFQSIQKWLIWTKKYWFFYNLIVGLKLWLHAFVPREIFFLNFFMVETSCSYFSEFFSKNNFMSDKIVQNWCFFGYFYFLINILLHM